MAYGTYDLVVLGGGPGGYVAAIRASQLGLRVVIIEAEHLGGICLNWGCIPTKALLRAAEVYNLAKRLGEFGVSASDLCIDLPKIIDRSRKVAAQLTEGVAHLLKKNKIEVIQGRGRILEIGKVAVELRDGGDHQVVASNILIATGARAREIPGFEVDKSLIWSYREAMMPKELPNSLLVVGSGAIGIEFASFFNDLGVEVTVVELKEQILPSEDTEISDLARKSFEKAGIKFYTSSSITSLERGSNNVIATIDCGKGSLIQLEAERVIMAVGITGNTEDIGLEEIGVASENGHVVIDDWCKTNVEGIYAIGDVAGPPWLAHKASHEGILCVEHIAGIEGIHPIDVTKIPGCTYSSPQIASVGLSEVAAMDAGHEVRVGRFPYRANGKATALGEPEGLVKTIFDKHSGELLGAHMVGPEVTELIQGYTIARTLECTEMDLIRSIFPHPTLSEMMHESVLDALGRVIHY